MTQRNSTQDRLILVDGNLEAKYRYRKQIKPLNQREKLSPKNSFALDLTFFSVIANKKTNFNC